VRPAHAYPNPPVRAPPCKRRRHKFPQQQGARRFPRNTRATPNRQSPFTRAIALTMAFRVSFAITSAGHRERIARERRLTMALLVFSRESPCSLLLWEFMAAVAYTVEQRPVRWVRMALAHRRSTCSAGRSAGNDPVILGLDHCLTRNIAVGRLLAAQPIRFSTRSIFLLGAAAAALQSPALWRVASGAPRHNDRSDSKHYARVI